ncbi:universal stress protein [Trinickia sp. LjRoot230]|uniref:universal stress protein n=1 Tax=Trinickia sp. LjRoot230 TaxID=3342288 RepID=UPI003ECD767E
MYKRILAPIDGSPTSQRAFDFALNAARENHAELIPLFVVDVPIIAYQTPGFEPSIVLEALLREGKQLRSDTLKAMQREGVNGMPRVVEIDRPGMDVAERILQEARSVNADLLVVGTHGRRGIRRLVLGSVAERVARTSSCPVVMIPGSFEEAGKVDTTGTPKVSETAKVTP